MSESWTEIFKEFHITSALILTALIGLHILGALKHRFINKDLVLNRMWLQPVNTAYQQQMMAPLLRIAVYLIAFTLLLITIATLFHLPPPWPSMRSLWPKAAWIMHTFLSSIAFVLFSIYFTIAIMGKKRPLFPITVSTIFTGITIGMYYLFESHHVTQIASQQRLLFWGKLFLIFAFINIFLSFASVKREYINREKFPKLLKVVLIFNILLLLWVGLRQIANVDHFAWTLKPEPSITYGLIFIGSAIYVLLIIHESFWENIWPLFASYLAYGAILYGPLFYLLTQPHKISTHNDLLILFIAAITLTFIVVFYYTSRYWSILRACFKRS